MSAPMTQDKLSENIEFIKELLEKQKLVERLVHLQHSPNQEVVESLVHRQHLAQLKKKLRKLHAADLAHVLEGLPMADRQRLWEMVRDSRGGEVLMDVSDAVRAGLIESMGDEELLMVISQLDGDDLSYIAKDIPEAILQVALASLTRDDQQWLRSSFKYAEDTVGHLMSNEMVVVHADQTIDDAARTLRQLKDLPIHNDKLFVTDRRGMLTGTLNLQKILLTEPDSRIADVMATDIIKFDPEDDASEASMAFERYDLVSAPVVNARGKLIGRLTVDVVMDYIREESTEDMLSMAGLSGEEDLFAPIWHSARNRFTWLVINLCSAFVASRIIGMFSHTIAQLVALAALMPIVASVGGNTGNQTTALIIRSLSRGQITAHNTWHLIRKELSIGAVNGVILGLLVGLFAMVLYQNVHLALVISAAMLLNLIFASSVGLAVPMLLDKFDKDPALGSSVILTAATDSIGFLIFLGLATIFLVH